MPYIDNEKRQDLDPAIEILRQRLVGLESDDENNNMEYNISYVFARLLAIVYGDGESISFAEITNAMGLLETVKYDFYNRAALPMLNQQVFDNGTITSDVDPMRLSEVVVERKQQG